MKSFRARVLLVVCGVGGCACLGIYLLTLARSKRGSSVTMSGSIIMPGNQSDYQDREEKKMLRKYLHKGKFAYLKKKLIKQLEEDSPESDFYFNSVRVTPDESSEHPILIWWTPFTGDHGVYKKCKEEICFFTDERHYFSNARTRGFLFYGSDFKPTDLPAPRSSHHQWALLHEESPKNNYLFSTKKVMELFNHTSTFRRESDLPLTLQYLENMDSLTSKKYYITTDKKNSMLRDLSPVLYVQSDCDTPSDRDSYVKELMKYIKVDSYGKCLHNRDLPSSLEDPIEGMNAEEFLKIAAQYKFTLSLENAVCDDYITEKLWRPLVVGSVPVYYGSPSVKDWLPHSNSAVLITNFSSPKLLAEHLHQLNGNDTAYETHLQHKIQSKIDNSRLAKAMNERQWTINNKELDKGSFIDHFECMVCERISQYANAEKEGRELPTYQAHINHYGCPMPVSPLTGEPDEQSWWLEMYHKAHHEANALEHLLHKMTNFSAEQFYSEVINILETERSR